MSAINLLPQMPAILPRVLLYRSTVTETSLTRDRSLERRIYATALPVYWIINLVDTHVDLDTAPPGPDAAAVCRTSQEYCAGDLVSFVLWRRDLGPIPARELVS